VAPFPKLPAIIPPPPAGPTFDPNFYQNLVKDTLAPGQAELDALQAQLDELKALSVLAGVDVPGWISDFDEADLALSDFGDIEWGSPEPDLGPVTAYVTAQRDGILGQAANAPPIATVPILGPDSQPVTVVGAPPSQGGTPPPGSPPYVYHKPIPYPFDPAALVGAAQLTGPNPPFVKFDGFAHDNPAAGSRGWAALIEINPAKGGSFSASLVYTLHVNLTGIQVPVTYTIAVLVVLV
jgi:hypothetical protein